MFRKFYLSVLLFIVASTTSFANEIKIGDLKFHQFVLRATAPSAKVASGYITIQNIGTSGDRLIGGSANFAGKLEIHQMAMEDNIMKMSPLKDGLEIPAGSTVKLLPGGYHIMLMKLSDQLLAGESRMIELEFEKAGTVSLEFQVRSIAETMKLKHKH